MDISQSLFLFPSYIWYYLHLPAPWEHALLANASFSGHSFSMTFLFPFLNLTYSSEVCPISHFTHFLLISYYDLTSLQSISLVNIFLGLQFHTSNCLMSLSFYMFHILKSRDLKSICVPYWARGTTSHLIVKVNFVGGGEQWSLWADSHLLLQSWVVSLDWEPKQLEKRFSIFFFVI